MLEAFALKLFDRIGRQLCEGADDSTLDIPALLSVRLFVRDHRQEVVEHLARYVQLCTQGTKTVRIWSRRPRLTASVPILTPVVCDAATAPPLDQPYTLRSGDVRYELWVIESDKVRLLKVH